MKNKRGIIENYNMEISNLIKEYLDCYSQLGNPKLSKQANRRLMAIQASHDAWSIANSLILDAAQQNRIHGCQLLSKKLSIRLPEGILPNNIANFIYSQTPKTKLHWLCIAKSLLHLNSTIPMQMQLLQTDQERLALLRQMPTAIVQTHTGKLEDPSGLREKYLNANKQMLIDLFDKYTDSVLDVLEVFINQGTRLRCQILLRKIMELDIEEVVGVLENIFEREVYPSMRQEIFYYLEAAKNKPDCFNVIVAFYRNNFKEFSNEQFQMMIGYVLNKLQQKDQAYFADTFEFWNDIYNQFQNNNLSQQKSFIFKEAMKAFWRLICQRCLLTQIPEVSRVQQSNLTIDLDNADDIDATQPLQANKDAERFRQYAGDFMKICLVTLQHYNDFLNEVLGTLTKLAEGSLIDLELSLFILSTICDILPKYSRNSSSTVISILQRQQSLNEYLCGKTISLIGKLSQMFVASPQILLPCLQFLFKCLRYDSVAALASQSCCQILQQTDIQQSYILSQDLQKFLTHLYDDFFNINLGERTRNNIAKSMVIFVYKFRKNVQSYNEYLSNYTIRISTMDFKNRSKFLQSAIAAQFWLNIQTQSVFIPPFEKFLSMNANFMLDNIFASVSKQNLTQNINILNLALKTNAVSQVDIWVFICGQIIKKYINSQPPLPIIFTPLINLSNAALSLTNIDSTIKIAQAVIYWCEPAMILLGDIKKPKIQFIISNALVRLHLSILKIYQKFPQISQRITYSPTNMITFICNCFENVQIWEYELYKNSIGYLTLAVSFGASSQLILLVLFRNFKKFAEVLWTSVQGLLFAIYKSQSHTPILKALYTVKPILDSTNPLTDVFLQSLIRGQGKNMKNILISLY